MELKIERNTRQWLGTLAVGEMAGAFGRQDEEEVRRLIQELDRGSLI